MGATRFSGNLSGLGQLARNVGRLAEVPSRVAPEAAQRIAQLIEEEFQGEADPYGSGWPPHAAATIKRWGDHPILTLNGEMREGVTVTPMQGAGIAIEFSVEYAGYHQAGTGRMPAREVLPSNTMPALWSEALNVATRQAFGRAMGRSG